MATTQPTSLYLHLPFCRHKCAYCDLNAYAGLSHLMAPYCAALVKEIAVLPPVESHTVYFGGGTPSIMPLPLLRQTFNALTSSVMLLPDAEVSIEANPENLDSNYLTGLREIGFNRLSLGAQSANANELLLFQRTHAFADVVAAMGAARQAGFDNVSLDLIYGIPGQTISRWRHTLTRMIDLGPDHVSVYALSVDFATPMRAWVQRGMLAMPDDALTADMYELASELLEEAGFGQYEISSWAKCDSGPASTNALNDSLCPQKASRHNLQYWRNQPYLGIGAGAHGLYGGVRYANVANPAAYIARLNEVPTGAMPRTAAVADVIELDRKTEMDETMLTGLRLLREGVSHERFSRRFGQNMIEVYGAVLANLQSRRLIELDARGARLTRRGRLIANFVFERFVD